MLGVWLAALVLSACSQPATEVAGVAITAATSTTVPGPVAIDGITGLVWEAGGTYTADSFVVPVSFTPDRGGWLSRGAASQWAAMWFDDDLDGASDATLTLMAYRPATDPEVLVSEILQIDGVRQLTPAVEQTIGTRTMIVVDVEGDPEPQGGSVSECSLPASGQFTTSAGYEFFDDVTSFGIPACYRSRVWIVEVDDNTLTLVGTVEDEDRFDDLVRWLEDLLVRGLSFGATG